MRPLLFILAVLSLLMLPSCSSDGDSMEYFESLVSGKVSAKFSRDADNTTVYLWDKEKGKLYDCKWQSRIGLYFTTPYSIIFKDGVVGKYYDFHTEHPNSFRNLWDEYLKISDREISVYLICPIRYDEGAYVIDIGIDAPLVVEPKSKNRFITTYDKSPEGNGHPYREKVTFRKVNDFGDASLKTEELFYGSERELVTGIISMIRNDLGDEFDVYCYDYNDFYYKRVTINLDEVERETLESLDLY